MFILNWWKQFLGAVLAWFVIGAVVGCNGATWDVTATDGDHKTHWNWGFEIGSTFYIGPGKGSTTDVDNKFVGNVESATTQPAG